MVTPVASLETVREAVGAVPDPEMPAVTVADLGMVVDVRVDGDRVEVDLVPTYSACPATHVIRDEVERAVRRVMPASDVHVRFVNTVVWTPERISADGHRKLRDFGIAPPADVGGLNPPRPPGHVGRPTASSLAGSGQALLGIGRVTCPLCGSRDTVADSPFGPTPCRASHYCNSCRNPFEVIRP